MLWQTICVQKWPRIWQRQKSQEVADTRTPPPMMLPMVTTAMLSKKPTRGPVWENQLEPGIQPSAVAHAGLYWLLGLLAN